MIIGFDFDKVFIDYPPLVPYSFVDFLYKGSSVFKKNRGEDNSLQYRFPGLVEQRIRVFTHFPIFRRLIKKNLTVLKLISKDKNNKTYLVSSRFGFLRNRTETLLDTYRLRKYFQGIFFNYKNQQPHLFKEQTIKSLKIDTYVDDDLDLSLYLSRKIPSLKIFWIKSGNKTEELPKNIVPIKDLSELRKYLIKNGE